MISTARPADRQRYLCAARTATPSGQKEIGYLRRGSAQVIFFPTQAFLGPISRSLILWISLCEAQPDRVCALGARRRPKGIASAESASLRKDDVISSEWATEPSLKGRGSLSPRVRKLIARPNGQPLVAIGPLISQAVLIDDAIRRRKSKRRQPHIQWPPSS